MKKLVIVIGSVMLIAVIAYPVFAWGPCGGGRGNHMKGNWGGGQGYCRQYDKGYGDLSPEQQNKLNQLNKNFLNKTATLRNNIWGKSDELNTALNATDPDIEKAKALQREISDLRSQLAEHKLVLEIEGRKIAPNAFSGSRYGKGYRRPMRGCGPGTGYGRHMQGYGPGQGPGRCWN